jgi:hypothetical protein
MEFVSPSEASELGCGTNKTDAAERRISIDRESLKVFLCTRRRSVLAGFTARGQSWRIMAWTGKKKVFCVLEFAKTELIVTVQQRFRIMNPTEPPTDKTVCEWYMKFQQSGCLFVSQRWNFMYRSRIVLSVGGSVWYMVRNLRCTITIESVLSNSKTQNAFLFPVYVMFRHDCP